MTLAIDSTSYVSPNHSSRNGRGVSLLVLHATAGNAASSLGHLINPAPGGKPQNAVSIHYLIAKSGAVYQLVPEALAAWHAGAATWLGLGSDAIRECSIGIELENRNDSRDPYPAEQMDALTELARALIDRYHIRRENVVRHLDIAVPRGRKSDPAGFPWMGWVDALYLPADPFTAWGAIGRPEGDARNYAIPKAWLVNKALGACVVAEFYPTPAMSFAVFERGMVWYNVAKRAAFVEWF